MVYVYSGVEYFCTHQTAMTFIKINELNSRTFIFARNWCVPIQWVKRNVCIGVCASVRTDRTESLPGRAKKKDVLRLWQVNHLSFQSQTADLHPRELVLVLHSLHIQQALLLGITSHLWIFHYMFFPKSASKLGTSSVHSLFLNLYVFSEVLHASSTTAESV